MSFLGKASLSIVKGLLWGAQRQNKFFTLLIAKTQLIPTPIIPLSIVASTIPGRSVGTISLNDIGTKYTMAGDVTFEDWKVTIRTFEYLDYRQIKSWFELIHSPMNGQRALPKDYKTICTVSQLEHSSGFPMTNILLKGVFPKSIGEIQLDESVPELIKFDVVLNVDDIIFL